MKLIAMVTASGTACTETVLVNGDDTPDARRLLERQFCRGGSDDPVAGSWTDVSDNDACHPDYPFYKQGAAA